MPAPCPYTGERVALGSSYGTVVRSGTPLEACIAKAELALTHGGTSLAIASAGCLGPHPAVPLLPSVWR